MIKLLIVLCALMLVSCSGSEDDKYEEFTAYVENHIADTNTEMVWGEKLDSYTFTSITELYADHESAEISFLAYDLTSESGNKYSCIVDMERCVVTQFSAKESYYSEYLNSGDVPEDVRLVYWGPFSQAAVYEGEDGVKMAENLMDGEIYVLDELLADSGDAAETE